MKKSKNSVSLKVVNSLLHDNDHWKVYDMEVKLSIEVLYEYKKCSI